MTKQCGVLLHDQRDVSKGHVLNLGLAALRQRDQGRCELAAEAVQRLRVGDLLHEAADTVIHSDTTTRNDYNNGVAGQQQSNAPTPTYAMTILTAERTTAGFWWFNRGSTRSIMLSASRASAGV